MSTANYTKLSQMERFDLDKQIEKCSDVVLLTEPEIKILVSKAKEVLSKEDNVQAVSAPVTICGDVHGQFHEDIIVFDKKLQDNLLLAYSLTSYKLQGSECPYVITLVTPQFEKSLNKNIIYTDMSRTRKEVVEIIDPTTLANTITIDSIQERLTNLERLLKEKYNNA